MKAEPNAGRRLSLTSWTLHPLLQQDLALLEVPERIQAAGIGTLEICHFHFPSTEPAYLDQLRAALDAAGVELFSILIDMGDISSADPVKRTADLQAITGWIDIAATLGAQVVRVVAGESQPDDQAAMERAIAGLRELSEYATACGVRVLTENFRELASTPENCHRLLDSLHGAIGLCADIGNFPTEQRVADFAAVIGRANSVHVKAAYDSNGQIDAGEVQRCLDASLAAGFAGPYTLVYDRPGDIWARVAELRAIVAPYTVA